MATFVQYVVEEANGEFKKREAPLQDPPRGYVRVKVHACGVCHSDCFTKYGAFPGLKFPRAPGHEIAGVVDKIGEDVRPWKEGDRVGVGWYGGHCGICRDCRRGQFVLCPELPVAGIHYDGGYGEYVVAKAEALAKIPDSLSFQDAAPLLCAGVTVFHGLRRNAPPAGELVGVEGVGGLGHLGIQFANKMGYEVVVFSRGTEKKELAMKLGAHHYFDTNASDFIEQVQKLGGIKTILASTSNPAAMAHVLPALGTNGVLVILGAGQEEFAVNALHFISGQRSVHGHSSGTSADSEDALRFAALTGVRSMDEIYPSDKVPEAFARMESGKATFRVVIDWEKKE